MDSLSARESYPKLEKNYPKLGKKTKGYDYGFFQCHIGTITGLTKVI